MNNIFLFNVSKNYSKLPKDLRHKEIHDSMASRFFAKTLFVSFQMMFVMKRNRYINDLEKKYNSDKAMRMIIYEFPFSSYLYLKYGSLVDNLFQAYIPNHAKRPLNELQYGKSFIIANLHKLASQILKSLNLNTLSLFHQNHAITSATFYGFCKGVHFVLRKFDLVVYFLLAREIMSFLTPLEKGGRKFTFLNRELLTSSFERSKVLLFGSLMILQEVQERINHFFPLPDYDDAFAKIKKSIIGKEGVNNYLSSQDLDFNILLCIYEHFIFQQFLKNLFVWHAVYYSTNFLLEGHIRLVNAIYNFFYRNFTGFVQHQFRIRITNPLVRQIERLYNNVRRRKNFEEMIKTRMYERGFHQQRGYVSLSSVSHEHLLMISPQENVNVETSNYTYVDEYAYFDDLDDEEEFLNRRHTVCFDQTLLPISIKAQKVEKQKEMADPHSTHISPSATQKFIKLLSEQKHLLSETTFSSDGHFTGHSSSTPPKVLTSKYRKKSPSHKKRKYKAPIRKIPFYKKADGAQKSDETSTYEPSSDEISTHESSSDELSTDELSNDEGSLYETPVIKKSSTSKKGKKIMIEKKRKRKRSHASPTHPVASASQDIDVFCVDL